MQIDIPYLQRITNRTSLADIVCEPKFLDAQTLFFDVVAELGGSVDFDIADMREVHAIAALGSVVGMRVLDIGCGSTDSYVLDDTFRDRYPPFLAEMLTKRGALVTGIDIRPNPSARYEHRVLDLTKSDWTRALEPPYAIVVCLNIFNAPKSPFEHDADLCNRMMRDMHALLSESGMLIVTLRDGEHDTEKGVGPDLFSELHRDGNCIWLRRA